MVGSCVAKEIKVEHHMCIHGSIQSLRVSNFTLCQECLHTKLVLVLQVCHLGLRDKSVLAIIENEESASIFVCIYLPQYWSTYFELRVVTDMQHIM